MKRKVIVVFGKPGSGKGSRLSEFLKEREEQYDVMSGSAVLLKTAKEQTELGKIVEERINAGELVPDEIVNKIYIDELKKTQKTVILDGFPRTIAQANAMLEAGIYPDIVIECYVDDDTVLKRAKNRLFCEECRETYTLNEYRPPKVTGVCDKCGGNLSQRKDDKEDIVKKRLQIYSTETYPVLDVFREAEVKVCRLYNYKKTAAGPFAKLILEQTCFSKK